MPEPEIKIPEIPRAVWQDLVKRVQPVVRKGKKKFFIKPCDPVNMAYTWDPVLTTEVTGLFPLASFECLHKYGYYGLFKPSVGEVLRQIPAEHRAAAVAFEIVEQPETAEDFKKHKAAFDAGFHVSKVMLYSSAKVVGPDLTEEKTRFNRNEPI